MFTLGDFNSLNLIWHNHEGRAENDQVKFLLRKCCLHFIEIHKFDGHIFMVFEEFLAGRDIMFIIIYPNNFRALKTVNNAVKGMTSGSTNIQNTFSWFLSSPISNPSVCSPILSPYNTW